MNRKIINRFFCIMLTIALILPCSAVSFADDAEDEGVLRASTLDEYIEATDPADTVTVKDDEIFSTCRIEVKKELDSLEGAVEGASYQGETRLRFGSVAETKLAYTRLCKEYGENNVIVDIPLMCADSVSVPKGWGTEFMNIDEEVKRRTQEYGQNAGKVTIAVIDSGIDSSHEIFNGREISQKSKNFKSSSLDYADEHGHGTSVAGIISESAPDNVDLMILKVFEKNNKEISSINVCDAIKYAADEDADVINLSMSVYMKELMEKEENEGRDPNVVMNAMKNMDDQLRYASEKGVIICASAGNEDKDMDQLIAFPAVSEYTIAVGAVNKEGKKSYLSNYGEKLDFCASGDNLKVAKYNSKSGYYENDSNHCWGTSFSAPYIATCCALVKMNDPAAGNEEAKQALKAICVDYGVKGWDPYYGWGMPKYEGDDEASDENTAVDPDKEKSEADARARSVTSVKVGGRKVTAASIRAAIAAAGGRNEYVTELVIGKGVRKISRKALKGTRIRTIVIKSRKLKRKTVKGSLKGSSVRRIKVKVGSKKVNKKYVRRYKAFFMKKNSGRKVKVTR